MVANWFVGVIRSQKYQGLPTRRDNEKNSMAQFARYDCRGKYLQVVQIPGQLSQVDGYSIDLQNPTGRQPIMRWMPNELLRIISFDRIT